MTEYTLCFVSARNGINSRALHNPMWARNLWTQIFVIFFVIINDVLNIKIQSGIRRPVAEILLTIWQYATAGKQYGRISKKTVSGKIYVYIYTYVPT